MGRFFWLHIKYFFCEITVLVSVALSVKKWLISQYWDCYCRVKCFDSFSFISHWFYSQPLWTIVLCRKLVLLHIHIVHNVLKKQLIDWCNIDQLLPFGFMRGTAKRFTKQGKSHILNVENQYFRSYFLHAHGKIYPCGKNVEIMIGFLMSCYFPVFQLDSKWGSLPVIISWPLPSVVISQFFLLLPLTTLQSSNSQICVK